MNKRPWTASRAAKIFLEILVLSVLIHISYLTFWPKHSTEIQGKVVKFENNKLYIVGNYIQDNKVLRPEKTFVVSVTNNTFITRIALRKLTDEELKLEGGTRFKISKGKGTVENLISDKISDIDIFSISDIYGTTTFEAFKITYSPI